MCCSSPSPDEFVQRFFSTRPRGHLPENVTGITTEHVRELNNAYDAAIAYLDHQLGVLFRELEGAGLLEDTLIVITSDHGEQFGEHGLLTHGNSLYLPLLHVPLLISYPRGYRQERW